MTTPTPEEKLDRAALKRCLAAVELYAANADENGTGLGAYEACQKVRNIVCSRLGLKKRSLREIES